MDIPWYKYENKPLQLSISKHESILTSYDHLGASAEYHSDSVCIHGRTKTSWLVEGSGATLYVMPFPGITGRNRFNPVKSK